MTSHIFRNCVEVSLLHIVSSKLPSRSIMRLCLLPGSEGSTEAEQSQGHGRFHWGMPSTCIEGKECIYIGEIS